MVNLLYVILFGILILILIGSIVWWVNNSDDNGHFVNSHTIDWDTVDPIRTVPRTAGYFHKIPLIIHQTFVDTTIAKTLVERVNIWRDNNPEYEHRYYTNNECVDIINENFDESVLHAYKSLIPGAAKADLFRYCILYLHGGVYADIPTRPMIPLRKMLNGDEDAVLVLDRTRGEKPQDIFNAFIAIVPKHDLMKQAIDECVKRINDQKITNIIDLTGPKLLGDVYETGSNVINRRIWRNNLDQVCGWGKVKFYLHKTSYIYDPNRSHHRDLIETKYAYYDKDRRASAGYYYTELMHMNLVYRVKAPEDIKYKKHGTGIPKLIMQTWTDDYITVNMKKALSSWINKNHKYGYKYFTDDRCRKDAARISDDTLKAYDSLHPGALKADLWKICALYLRGGIYADADMTCLTDMNAVIKDNDFVLCIDTNNNTFCNSFIACNPKLKVMREVIDYIVSNVLDQRYDLDHLALTGPIAFTKIIMNHYSKLSNRWTKLKPGTYRVDGLKFKILVKKDDKITDAKNNVLINSKYPNYDKERIVTGGTDYVYLWKNKMVYQ